MKSSTLIAGLFVLAAFLTLGSQNSEAGQWKLRWSKSWSYTSTHRDNRDSARDSYWRSDYRGQTRQPAYRSFYRHNAFFPGYNYTSPYGYDYE